MRVLILSTNWRFTRCLSVALNVAGHEVFTTASRRRSPETFTRRSTQVMVVDPKQLQTGEPAVIDRINRVIREHRIDAVIPAFTDSVDALSGRQHLLDCPCFPLADPDTIGLMRDKQRFAAYLDRIGVAQPDHVMASTADDAASIPFDGPYIVKPPRGEGGEDVVAVADRVAVARRLAQIVPSRGPQLVQSFIPGIDIDLSLLADRGKIVAYTIQRKTARRGELEFVDHPAVADACAKIAAGCQFHGVMHLDLRLDGRDGRVYAIESNPRFWNTMRYSFAMGVNFADLGLRIMQGQRVEPMTAPPVGVCKPADFNFSCSSLGRLLRPDKDLPEAYRAICREVRRDPLPDVWYALVQLRKPWKPSRPSAGDSAVGQRLLELPKPQPTPQTAPLKPAIGFGELRLRA